ncbi:hypothetical protein ABW19_dt0207234 [Dactylella cylindrospora]|nr:hypothetical protein ABW19_dt0207234 [Dactylella cylindrospora]
MSSSRGSGGGGGGGVTLILGALKWRWLAKRVFFPFSSSSSSTPSKSSSSSSSQAPSTQPSSPSKSRPPPPTSPWDFRRFFSFKLFLPALPPSSTKSNPKEDSPPSHPPPEPILEAPLEALISPSPAAPSIPAPLPDPIQLPTPPATPPPPPAPPSKYPPNQSYLNNLPPLPPLPSSTNMSDLPTIHTKIISSFAARSHKSTLTLLATAKLTLLNANALIPAPSTSPQILNQARDILEIGALTSIYLSDTESFSRYYNYLQPFYKLPSSTIPPSQHEAKILGLYLLFLLSQGDSAGFHTALEVLNQEGTGDSEKGWQWGEFVRYPVTLERWLMEGSYDKVWEATRKSKTPTEEFDVFTKILVSTLRQEIATSAERAYPSLPISNAKNLLFLDTEKDVLQFARERDWEIRDGRIYFPLEEEYDDIPDTASVAAVKTAISSGTIIENTIGYANELEQIV